MPGPSTLARSRDNSLLNCPFRPIKVCLTVPHSWRENADSVLDDPAAKYVSQRPPEQDLGSEHTNQQVRSWLKDCLERHPEFVSLHHDSEFVSRNGLPPLPTRVVDVGTVANPQSKLFEPSSITHEQYVTLSYCWGRDRFITTTLVNIEAHKQTLDWCTLPQTFKDAIQTTRNLGFKYIWIDALCIIQDSTGDKAKEISKMGDIYNNATLTIAVVGATRVAEGFLKTKPQISVNIPYLCPNGEIGSVRVAAQRAVDLWQEVRICGFPSSSEILRRVPAFAKLCSLLPKCLNRSKCLNN